MAGSTKREAFCRPDSGRSAESLSSHELQKRIFLKKPSPTPFASASPIAQKPSFNPISPSSGSCTMSHFQRTADFGCAEQESQAHSPSLGANLFPLDREPARLVHLAPALVGPSDPDLVRQRRSERIVCYDGEGVASRGNKRAICWTQDEDVLDTWFSSGLWPFSVSGWPDKTAESRKNSIPPHPHHRPRHPLFLGRANDPDGRIHHEELPHSTRLSYTD